MACSVPFHSSRNTVWECFGLGRMFCSASGWVHRPTNFYPTHPAYHDQARRSSMHLPHSLRTVLAGLLRMWAPAPFVGKTRRERTTRTCRRAAGVLSQLRSAPGGAVWKKEPDWWPTCSQVRSKGQVSHRLYFILQRNRTWTLVWETWQLCE